jgi:hypothetical protein
MNDDVPDGIRRRAQFVLRQFFSRDPAEKLTLKLGAAQRWSE